MKVVKNNNAVGFFLAFTTIHLGVFSACDGGSKKKDKGAAAPVATGTKVDAKPQSPSIDPACLTQGDEAAPANDAPGETADAGTTQGQTGTGPQVGQPATQCAPTNKPAPTDSGAPGGGTASPGGTPPSGDGTAWTPGLGLTGCAEQGKIWIAVNKANPGKSGSCGESLAAFCCTQSGVLEKFPSYKSKLEPEFAKFSGEGLILYGCSTDGVGKTTLHFANINQNAVYKSIWLGEKSAAGAPADSCPKVTMENLGYKPTTSSGTNTATSTGTTTSTGVSTGTATSSGTGTSTGTGTGT